MANVILYSQLGYRPLMWRIVSCYVLARWIEEHGYTCQVIEFTHLFSPQELIDTTKMFIDKDTIMIGASSTMWSTWSGELMMNIHARSVPENIHSALTELKSQFPKIQTVLGGHRLHDLLQGLDIFDHISESTYGEDWLLKFLDELTNKSMVTQLQLKKFDISSHRFVYKKHDCILPGETLPLEWGRGCIFKCPFCRNPNLGKRGGTDEKNIELMVDEFTEMYETFGTTSYYFIDETFNSDVKRIENLANVYYKLPFKLEFLAYNRADLVDAHPHTQDILHECGQRGTLFGIETFHPEAAKLVLKPWSAKRGKDFLLHIQDKWPNTHIDASLIAGIPGVSREHHFETADWFLKSKISTYQFKPLIMIDDRVSKTYTQSTWEVDSKDLEITWPDENEMFNWRWGDSTYMDAYKLAVELNQYINYRDRFFMWALGALTCTGVTLKDVANKPKAEILSLTGDLYDQEIKLFSLYKEQLKGLQGR